MRICLFSMLETLFILSLPSRIRFGPVFNKRVYTTKHGPISVFLIDRSVQ